MSFILDAIRQSEEERCRDETPNPFLAPSRGSDSQPNNPRWPYVWPYVLSAVLAFNLVALIAWSRPWLSVSSC